MSRQSDLDNHANQLNPNNDEYYNCRSGGSDSDDELEESGTALHASKIMRDPVRHPDSLTRCYGFGAVSLNGEAIYARATVEVGGSLYNQSSLESACEDFLEYCLEKEALRFVERQLRASPLALFAVFDASNSCLPWHVPMDLQDALRTSEAITLDRFVVQVDALKPLPRVDLAWQAMARALSSDDGARQERIHAELLAGKLDPEPFVAALRAAVLGAPIEMGKFECSIHNPRSNGNRAKIRSQLDNL